MATFSSPSRGLQCGSARAGSSLLCSQLQWELRGWSWAGSRQLVLSLLWDQRENTSAQCISFLISLYQPGWHLSTLAPVLGITLGQELLSSLGL